MKSCRNFSQQTTRSTPLDPNLMFRCVSYYLGAFRTVCCVTTLSSKWAKLVQKFAPRSRVGIFHSERTRSTPLDSKLMFWCVSYYLGVFGIVWLPYKILVQNGLKWCKSSCYEVVSEFFTTNHSIHPIGPNLMFRCVTYYLGAFGTVC